MVKDIIDSEKVYYRWGGDICNVYFNKEFMLRL